MFEIQSKVGYRVYKRILLVKIAVGLVNSTLSGLDLKKKMGKQCQFLAPTYITFNLLFCVIFFSSVNDVDAIVVEFYHNSPRIKNFAEWEVKY